MSDKPPSPKVAKSPRTQEQQDVEKQTEHQENQEQQPQEQESNVDDSETQEITESSSLSESKKDARKAPTSILYGDPVLPFDEDTMDYQHINIDFIDLYTDVPINGMQFKVEQFVYPAGFIDEEVLLAYRPVIDPKLEVNEPNLVERIKRLEYFWSTFRAIAAHLWRARKLAMEKQT